MTSSRLLRSLGPLRSFSTSTTSSSSVDPDDANSGSNISTTTAGSSIKPGDQPKPHSIGHQQNQQQQRQGKEKEKQKERFHYASSADAAAAAAATTTSTTKGTKPGFLDKFTSLPRSQTWAKRRLSVFFPDNEHFPPQGEEPLPEPVPRRNPNEEAVAATVAARGVSRSRAKSVFDILPPKTATPESEPLPPGYGLDPPGLNNPGGSWKFRPRNSSLGRLPPFSPDSIRSPHSPSATPIPTFQQPSPHHAVAAPVAVPGRDPASPSGPPRSPYLASLFHSSPDQAPTLPPLNLYLQTESAPSPPPSSPLPQLPRIVREEEEEGRATEPAPDPGNQSPSENKAIDMRLAKAPTFDPVSVQSHQHFSMPIRKDSLPGYAHGHEHGHAHPHARPPPLTIPRSRDASPAPPSGGRVPAVAARPGFRSVSAQVPPTQPVTAVNTGSPRVSSNPTPAPLDTSRPSSSGSHGQALMSPAGLAPEKEKETRKLRRSWFPSRSRSNSQDFGQPDAQAWIMDTKIEYNTAALVQGDMIPELWTDSGDVYVYLFPKEAGMPPSFKIPQMVINSSFYFNDQMRREHMNAINNRGQRNFSGRPRLSADDPRDPSPPLPLVESHLYLVDPPDMRPDPVDPLPDIERLVAIRNLFAFLMGQPLVATKKAPNNFEAFLLIAGLLEEYCFSNEDRTSFGEIADMVFSNYIDEMGLADLRRGKEKILQALVLSERMHCIDLYNSAFAHAVGRHVELVALKSPLLQQVTLYTRQKIERAHLNLANRLQGINLRLEQFDFPSLFVGMACSTSNEEIRNVRFKTWRTSFHRMRSFVLSYYKNAFGSWPPKASSKRNPFSESGLNRLVLKALYSDLCALYDMLVDRTDMTPRELHGLPENIPMTGDGMISGLRRLLSEFENSVSPIPPPIPFDTPLVPSMTSVRETYNELSAKEQARFDKKIKEHELTLVLNKAYNIDVSFLKIRFLEAFKEFELKEARGRLQAELANQRVGYWIFLYVVLQSLPLLVVDAPGLKNTEGVEYFLCEAPWGNPPWIEYLGMRKMWYEVAGGAGLVELPADYIMFSTEAIYLRSHCWVAAKDWEEGQTGTREPMMSPLDPPSHVFHDSEPASRGSRGSPYLGPDHRSPSPSLGSPALLPPPAVSAGRSRNPSPGPGLRHHANRSSIFMGIEPLKTLDSLDILNSTHGFPDHRSSSVDPRAAAMARRPMPRVQSSGNLAVMTQLAQQHDFCTDSASSESPAGHTGQTFDDILGSQPKGKKKSRFF